MGRDVELARGSNGSLHTKSLLKSFSGPERLSRGFVVWNLSLAECFDLNGTNLSGAGHREFLCSLLKKGRFGIFSLF